MDYLPNEIFVFIIHLTKPSEWFNLRRVNKHFQIIIESVIKRYPLMRDKLSLSKVMPQVDNYDILKTKFNKDSIEEDIITTLVQKCDYEMLALVADKRTILYNAIKMGQIDVIKWINIKSNAACYCAVTFKQLNVLKWLFDHDYPQCHDLLNASLKYKSVDIFQWLLGQKDHLGKVYDYDMIRDYKLLYYVSPYHAKNAYEKGYFELNDEFIYNIFISGDIKIVRWFVQEFCTKFHIVGKFNNNELTDDEWLIEYHKYNDYCKNGINVLGFALRYLNFSLVLQCLKAGIKTGDIDMRHWIARNMS